MNKLIFLLSLSFLTNIIFAARLEMQSPFNITPERYYQYKVYYIDDSGVRSDVTNDVQFSSFERISTSSYGEVKIHVPFNITSSRMFVNLTARYFTPDSSSLTVSKNINVDLTPDFISLLGPSSVMSRGFASYRAYGSFSGVRVDLTNAGNWRARYGRVSYGGSYYAPTVNNRQNLIDTVSFSFASRFNQLTVYVR